MNTSKSLKDILHGYINFATSPDDSTKPYYSEEQAIAAIVEAVEGIYGDSDGLREFAGLNLIKPLPEVPSKPLGQKVDCDVCIAKAGQPCYLQTSADEHSLTGHSYNPGNSFIGKERFHVGIRTKAEGSLDTDSYLERILWEVYHAGRKDWEKKSMSRYEINRAKSDIRKHFEGSDLVATDLETI